MTQAKRLLILLASINLLNYMDRYVVPSVAVQMGGEFSLSRAQVGSLMSVFLIVYMLAAPVFGFLGDRYSRPRLVAFGIVLWSLATAAAALSVGYRSLLFTRALVGVGEAAYVALGPAMLSDLYPEKDRARVFTWFFLAIPVGSALGYGLGGLVAHLWGWRSAFLVAGVPGLLFAWRMLRVPDPPRGAMDSGVDPALGLPFHARIGIIFGNRVWLAATACYIAYTFAMGALSWWSPDLLQGSYALSEADAGMLFGAMAVVTGLLGTLAGGKLTDRLQARWPDAGLAISGLSLVLAAPAVHFAIRATSLRTAIALYSVGMFLLFVNTSPVNAVIVSSLSASVRATGVALNVLLIHLLGDALSPWWVGHRADVFQASGVARAAALTQGLALVIPAIALGGLALWWARSRHRGSS
jgi:MFS transporter, Spinster family, sphingosine-1-phosphate transporter